MKGIMDILYIGVNMGNSGVRFFPRYKGAEDDYYETFFWLIEFSNAHPEYKIGIKHHPGDYRPYFDNKEMMMTSNTNLIYIDNQQDTYKCASEAKLVVSYCSIMVLELNGYPNLAWFIREKRKQKRYIWRRPCKRPGIPVLQTNYYNAGNYPPAYYLDPGGRNRHFCKYTDEICVHDCNTCKPMDLEVFNPYRLTTYEQFEKTALDKLIYM